VSETAQEELPEDEAALEELPEDKGAPEELPEDEAAQEELPKARRPRRSSHRKRRPRRGCPRTSWPRRSCPRMRQPWRSCPRMRWPWRSCPRTRMEEPALKEPDLVENGAAPMARPRWPAGWLQAGLAMVPMLCLARQERLVMGFVVYDGANATNRVDAYSLLEPAACATIEDHQDVERTIFEEIIQMKRDHAPCSAAQ
jgi:hypothetical protein